MMPQTLKLIRVLPRRQIQTAAILNRQENVMNIFDRTAKARQRERAALREDVDDFDYLKEELGFRLADRVLDITR